MAEMSNPQFHRRLKEALSNWLQLAGIRGDVVVEQVPRTRLARVFIVTSQRDSLEPVEWYSLVTRCVRDEIGEMADRRVSSVFALTSSQLQSYRQQRTQMAASEI